MGIKKKDTVGVDIEGHCSECKNFWSKRPFMYCTYLQKRITARKTPKKL